MSDIQAVDMDASGIVTAMISGGVDACATWSPNSLKIMEEIPEATKLADNMTLRILPFSLASWIVTPKVCRGESGYHPSLYKSAL